MVSRRMEIAVGKGQERMILVQKSESPGERSEPGGKCREPMLTSLIVIREMILCQILF